MTRVLLRRLALLPPTLIALSLLVFATVHLVPGDPAEIMLGESAAPADLAALRHALGLDLPPGRQLLHAATAAARGDLGWSVAYRAPVRAVIAARWPATVELAAAALLLAVAIAVPLGLLAALRRDRAADRAVRLVSLAGTCVPAFSASRILVL